MSSSKSETDSEPVIVMGEPVYFWRPHEDNGYLGQWFNSTFTETQPDGKELTFKCAEQYMMYYKGLLFAPSAPETALILRTTDPARMKALGRKIPNFDEKVWNQNRMKIVTRANVLKFTQNPDLKKMLLETGTRPLVEASPRDKIWGIGWEKWQAEKKRKHWGLNLLGICLEQARAEILEAEKNQTK